jgi:hypothetical protein
VEGNKESEAHLSVSRSMLIMKVGSEIQPTRDINTIDYILMSNLSNEFLLGFDSQTSLRLLSSKR